MSYSHGLISVLVTLVLSYLGMQADENKSTWQLVAYMVGYTGFIFWLGCHV